MRTIAMTFVAVCGLLLVSACNSYNASLTAYELDQAGVVVTAAPSTTTQSTLDYSLRDGQTVSVDSHSWIYSSAVAGDLLLAGSRPAPWALAVRPGPQASSECFSINSAAFDHGDSVAVAVTVEAHDAYVRLPKASGVVPADLHNGVCVDEAGRAHSIPLR